MKKNTNVDAAWARIKGNQSFRPPTASKYGDEVFEYVLDSVFLSDDVKAWFALHGGESKPEALTPLRLVSLDEATDFALALLKQMDPDEHVRAAETLAEQHFMSAAKQNFSSNTEYSCVWTLALGEPGHRLAVDLDAEFVVEHFADGHAEKRADSFADWLAQLGGKDA